MEDMKAVNKDAHDDFIARGPAKFCRGLISTRCSCDMIVNTSQKVSTAT